MTSRTVVVTGAGQGLGAGIAEKFALGGDTVFVTDRNGDAATTVASSIIEAGGRAVGVRCDVTDRVEVEAVTERAVTETGRLDVLVNNAGVTRDNLVFKMTDEDWAEVLATHLTG